LPLPALAAADAPSLATQINGPRALRSLQRCQKYVNTQLEGSVTFNDYTAVQSAFRSEPLVNLRKSASSLVSLNNADLAPLYKTVMMTLESLDGTAGSANRGGKKVTEQELTTKYTQFRQALDDFVVQASKSVVLDEL